MKRIIWMILLLVVLPFSTVAYGQEHSSEKVRLFALSTPKEALYYADLPDFSPVLSGPSSSMDSFGITTNGRFLVFLNRSNNVLSIFSSGLSLEPHGDHVDIVAGAPVLYWDFGVGRSPASLTVHNDLVGFANTVDGTVSIVNPESGLAITLPAGGIGPIAFDNRHLIALDQQLELIDIVDLASFELEFTLRARPDPRAIALVGSYFWVACREGIEIVELHSLERFLIPIEWSVVPKEIFVHGGTFWVFTISSGELLATSSQSAAVHRYGQNYVRFVSDESQLMAFTELGNVDVFDIRDGAPVLVKSLVVPGDYANVVRDIYFHDHYIFVARDKTVYVFSNSGELETEVNFPDEIDTIVVAEISEKYRLEMESWLKEHGHNHDH